MKIDCRRPALLTLLLLLATSSCTDRAPRSAFTVSDSAGVRIARSSAPAWSADDAWTVDTLPLLDIGDEAAGAGHDLSDIGGFALLSDGRIAVANGGTFQVRFFAADGRFLGAVGGEGEGPGEYRDLGMIRGLPGDSLLISDRALDRLTILAPDGSYARGAPLRPAAFTPSLLLADGTLLARTGFTFGARDRTGVRRDTGLVARFALDGTVVDTLGRFPGGTQYVFVEGERALAGPLLFAAQPAWAAWRDGFLFGTGDAPRLEVRSADGRLTGILDFDHPSVPVTEEHREQLFQQDAPPDQATAALMRRYLSAMPLPDRFPAFTRIITSADGHVWLQEYTFPPDAPPTWQVLDPEGRWLGAVRLPSRFELRAVTSDRVLGIGYDELDVEHVRAYRLVRPR